MSSQKACPPPPRPRFRRDARRPSKGVARFIETSSSGKSNPHSIPSFQGQRHACRSRGSNPGAYPRHGNRLPPRASSCRGFPRRPPLRVLRREEPDRSGPFIRSPRHPESKPRPVLRDRTPYHASTRRTCFHRIPNWNPSRPAQIPIHSIYSDADRIYSISCPDNNIGDTLINSTLPAPWPQFDRTKARPLNFPKGLGGKLTLKGRVLRRVRCPNLGQVATRADADQCHPYLFSSK